MSAPTYRFAIPPLDKRIYVLFKRLRRDLAVSTDRDLISIFVLVGQAMWDSKEGRELLLRTVEGYYSGEALPAEDR